MTATYNFPEHIRGDTFKGVDFVMESNSLPLNLVGATIKSQFRPKRNQFDLAWEFSTTAGSIVIQGASNNIIHFNDKPGTEMKVRPEVYLYDIEITFPSGLIKTYISGTFTVIDDVTK